MELVTAGVARRKAIQEPSQRALPEFGDPHANGGDTQMAGKRDVVEPGDYDLFRDAHARSAQCLERTDGHVVVGGKDCVEFAVARQEGIHGSSAGLLFEISLDHAPLESMLERGGLGSGGAFLRVDIRRGPGDVDDVLAAKRNEMVDYRSCAGGVVEVDCGTATGLASGIDEIGRGTRLNSSHPS